MSKIPNVSLSNGVLMPAAVFGVYQIRDLKECQKAVEDAIAAGYRAIDTAASYGNEAAVGHAIKACGLDRRELFITTKLWVEDASEEGARRAIDRSLDLLGLDYLDLYLIHQPVGDVYGAWRTMEKLHREGVLGAIGVSNFYPDRLIDFCHHQEICPMVNQVEIHPFFQQQDAIANMKSLGIQAEAWGPMAEGKHGIFTHPVLMEIGKKYGKTPAQIALRWNIQRGVVVIPKSVHRERMEENINIWDFLLSDDDMAEISKLDIGHSEIIDHSSADTAKWLNGWHIHD